MQLSSLYRYPLKSAQGRALERADISRLGVVGDRRWMLVDASSGRFLSQRELPGITWITAEWNNQDGLTLTAKGQPPQDVAVPDADSDLRSVTVWGDDMQVPDAGDEAAAWCSALLQRDCRLVHVPETRARQVDQRYAREDDRVAFADGFPLLLIGQSSLDDLSERVGRPMSMRQFRPNLVVAGALPYAEDEWKTIRIGDVILDVVKPCSRCVMITLDPDTGERHADREPWPTLMRYRKGEKGIYFGQNLIPRTAGEVTVGMAVEVLD